MLHFYFYDYFLFSFLIAFLIDRLFILLEHEKKKKKVSFNFGNLYK